MDEKALGDALNAIYDLEKDRHQALRLQAFFNKKIEEYERKGRYVKKPSLSFDEREKPLRGRDMEYLFRNLSVIPIIAVILLYFLLFFNVDSTAYWLVGVAVVAGSTLVLPYVCGLIGGQIDKKKYEARVEETRREWETVTAPALAEEYERKEAEAIRCNDVRVSYEDESRAVGELLRKNEETLRKMYDAVGIDADYRRLIPMRYIANFFSLGIARKFDGTDGLYYLVRKELRADQFHASLQDISEKLDTIVSKQSEVYRELAEINQSTRAMCQEAVTQFESAGSASSGRRADGIARYISRSLDNISHCASLEVFRHWAC